MSRRGSHLGWQRYRCQRESIFVIFVLQVGGPESFVEHADPAPCLLREAEQRKPMTTNDRLAIVGTQLPNHNFDAVAPKDDVVVGEDDLVFGICRGLQDSVPPGRTALVGAVSDHLHPLHRAAVLRVEAAAIVDHHDPIRHHGAGQCRLNQLGQQVVSAIDGNAEQECHDVVWGSDGGLAASAEPEAPLRGG